MSEEPQDDGVTTEVLARPPVVGDWPAGATVRRTVRRRRVRAGLAVSTALVAAAAATTLGVALGSGPGPATSTANPPDGPAVVLGHERVGARLPGAVQLVADVRPGTHVPSSPASLRAVAAAEQDFGLQVLRQLTSHASATENTTVSPYSLYVALAMLRDGARGDTAAELDRLLDTPGLTSAQLNTGLAGVTDALTRAAAAGGLSLQTANALWTQRGLRVGTAFLSDLSRYYGSGVWQTDFTTPAAVAAINRWTSLHTHGAIRQLFSQLDPSTVAVLANAVYLHARWQTPFRAELTEPGPFFRTAGKTVSAEYMSGGGSTLPSATTPTYQAAELPYAGGRFAALLVEPTDGTLSSFVAGLTPSTIGSIASSLRTRRVAIDVPRFTTRSHLDLDDTLRALGAGGLFGAPDLSGIAPHGPALQVSQVAQRTYLKVGEKGTTAAAVTGIAMQPLSAENPVTHLRFDHPFLFLIRDTTTGAILFASEINDPSA